MATIRVRRGTAALWTERNPTLSAGEPGLETDTGKVKYGNGTNTWNDLPYSEPNSADDLGAETPEGAQIKVDNLRNLVLDGSNTVLEERLPARLSDEVLKASYAARESVLSRAALPLVHKMRAGRNAAVALLGDSTGSDFSAWYWPTVSWLLDQFPDHYGTYRIWDHATQKYGEPLLAQSGAAGEPRFVTAATESKIFTVPAPTVTSDDLDIRVRVSLPSTTPPASYPLAGQFGASSNRAWFLELQTDGMLRLYWSDIGTGSISRAATAAIPTAVTTQAVWLRATLDADNGAGGHDVAFYYSTDRGDTWTQIGTTVTTTGTTSVFDSTEPVQLNGRSGTAGGFDGATYYGLRVLDGINGPCLVDIDFAPYAGVGSTFPSFTGQTVTIGGTNGTFAGGPTLSILNGSASGQNVTYHSDTTRFARIAPHPVDLTYIAHSHNAASDVDYRPDVKALTDKVLAAYPDSGLVLVAENPRQAPAANQTEHAIRVAQVVAFAQSQGFGVMDVWRAFVDHPDGVAALTAADGIHPNATGYTVWAELAEAGLAAWL